MASALTPIAWQSLGSATSSVTFSSIAGTYRDLILVTVTSRDTVQDGNQQVRFNSDTGSNYPRVEMGGNGSSASSRVLTTSGITDTSISNTVYSSPSSVIWNILDYAATDKHKSALVRANSNNGVVASAGRWASTSAVTSLTVVAMNGSVYAAGSTFALYGVSA
jgi:hypothetical protein